MSVQDTSLNAKIFDSAVKEFLEKGYLGASLKTICQNAGVTTGAIYKRYKGKADLFDAVVATTYENLREHSNEIMGETMLSLDDRNIIRRWEYDEARYVAQTNFIYDNYEGMRLLLVSSEGTKHHSFMHQAIMENTEQSYMVLKEAYKRGYVKKVIDKDTLHMVLTAYWTAIFEPVVHAYPREKAIESVKIVGKLFNWQDVFDAV